MKRKFDSEQFNFNGGEQEETDLSNRELPWQRGPLLGKGGFGSVYLGTLKNPNSSTGYLPELMAIKSAEISASISLQKEKEVLHDLCKCPYILHCYGQETTSTPNGQIIHNLLLEYASGGTLAGLIRQSAGRGLPESDVKRHTRSILRGIEYIHSHGYVHCDLKPDNVLLVPGDEFGDSFVPVIGDFGLAKKSKDANFDSSIGGTTLYMAPETVRDNIQERPSDIWALGCIVLEMLTGKKAWNPKPGMTSDEILRKIGDSGELPEIPGHISGEGKWFLKGCLVRNPLYRYTAGLLLIHPFVSGSDSSDDVKISGRLNFCGGEDELSGSEDWSFSDYSSSSSFSLGDCGVKKESRVLNHKLMEFGRAGVVKVV